MTYEHIVAGTFVSRPNRFIAHVKTGNRTVVCHVKNTGRCRELLVPGAARLYGKSRLPLFPSWTLCAL